MKEFCNIAEWNDGLFLRYVLITQHSGWKKAVLEMIEPWSGSSRFTSRSHPGWRLGVAEGLVAILQR